MMSSILLILLLILSIIKLCLLIKQPYLDNIFTGAFYRTEKIAVQERLLVKDTEDEVRVTV